MPVDALAATGAARTGTSTQRGTIRARTTAMNTVSSASGKAITSGAIIVRCSAAGCSHPTCCARVLRVMRY